jgi:hypothetical protein
VFQNRLQRAFGLADKAGKRRGWFYVGLYWLRMFCSSI